MYSYNELINIVRSVSMTYIQAEELHRVALESVDDHYKGEMRNLIRLLGASVENGFKLCDIICRGIRKKDAKDYMPGIAKELLEAFPTQRKEILEECKKIRLAIQAKANITDEENNLLIFCDAVEKHPVKGNTR
jgi:hypothetical protein